MHRILTTAVVTAALMGASGSGTAVAEPHPNDGGMANCNVFGNVRRLLAGYNGDPNPQPYRPYYDDFTIARQENWCSTSYGDGTLRFGPDGLTLGIAASRPEVLMSAGSVISHTNVEQGHTVTMKVDASGSAGLNGTTGWGIASRTTDPGPLETAWFFRNDTDGPLGPISQATTPIFEAIGSDLPRGFFVMVKRALGLPVIKQLDPAYLSGEHSYSVRLSSDKVEFFVDGAEVASFADPPTGRSIDISRQPVPLVGQIWIDSSYWFPYMWPQVNASGHLIRITDYQQGPNGEVPLVFD